MALSYGVGAPNQETKRSLAWEQVKDWLQGGDYQRVAAWLLDAQQNALQQGDKSTLHLLTAVYQVCMAVQMYDEEIGIKKEAYEATVAQAFEVRKQLEQLLQIICEENKIMIPSEHKELSIWNRLQMVIKRPEPTKVASQNEPILFKSIDSAKTGLTIYCLGNFRVIFNGEPIENWSGNKSKSLFKYMVAHRARPLHREQLMELFWPGDDPEPGRRNLYQAIYMIRKVFAQVDEIPTILCEDGCYLLNPGVPVWVDNEQFMEHYQNGRFYEEENQLDFAIQEYETGESLYQGAYLAEDIYEDWSVSYRENFKLMYLEILDKLSTHYWDIRNYPLCITYCHKILTEDNCREDAHRRLMMSHVRQGQRHLALRQYHRCVEALAQELDVEPMPATIKLYQNLQNDPTKI